MTNQIRESILNRLKNVPPSELPQHPDLPPLSYLSMSNADLIEAFTRNITEQSAQVYRVRGPVELMETLGTVLNQDSLARIFLSEDELMNGFGVKSWAEQRGITVFKASDFKNKEEYKEAVFTVDASFTAIDFAVAESGTLIIRHNEKNARLLSLAPLYHLALVPADRLVAVYESVLERCRTDGALPSQLTFITGPSMTADIQATPFRGMHGPRRLIVFLFDNA